MTTKLFAWVLLIFVVSCAGQSSKSNFGPTKSSVGNLSFGDIKNLKESQSCSDGSIGFARVFASMYTVGISELSISSYVDLYEDDKYKYYGQLLVDKSGDTSISTAAKLGGIKKVKMVDHSYSITGIMGRRYCVIVYGE